MNRLMKLALLSIVPFTLLSSRCGTTCICSSGELQVQAVERGSALKVVCCSYENREMAYLFSDPQVEVHVDGCGMVLTALTVEDISFCTSDTCSNVIRLKYPIQLYRGNDSLPAGGFYIKVIKTDTSVYLIGMNVKGHRTHLSPGLYNDLAPDTGSYTDTVLAIVPADPSYGHAVWMNAGSEDIDTVSYGEEDFFAKIRILEVRGDSVLIRVGYRMEVPGLRWIKGG